MPQLLGHGTSVFLSHSEGPTQFSHYLQQARRSEDLYSNPEPRGKHTLVYIIYMYTINGLMYLLSSTYTTGSQSVIASNNVGVK